MTTVLRLDAGREDGKVRVCVRRNGTIESQLDIPRSSALTFAAQLEKAARDRTGNDVYASEVVLEETG